MWRSDTLGVGVQGYVLLCKQKPDVPPPAGWSLWRRKRVRAPASTPPAPAASS